MQGSLGIVNGSVSEVELGVLPTLNALTGFAGYVIGGLLFGIATMHGGVMPRWAGALLAIAAVSVLGAALLPHPLERLLAVPMGLALASLGFAVWSGRREEVPAGLPTGANLDGTHTGDVGAASAATSR